MARNLTDSVDGFLRNATYLIHDRDPLFTEAFEAILAERGLKCVRIPARSPNCNPHAERFVKTVREECLNHLVLFGERHLRHVIKEFMAHYHSERFHQGLGGQLIRKQVGPTNDNCAAGKIVRRSRLGGVLNYYSPEAARGSATGLRMARGPTAFPTAIPVAFATGHLRLLMTRTFRVSPTSLRSSVDRN